MAPELQQNIFYTLYFTLAHNFLAIAYLVGLILTTCYSLYKPSRKATMFMIGFASLLFAFEYSKHIIEGLKEQTVNSVITETPHYRLEHAIEAIISKVVPIFLNFIGVVSLAIGAVMHFREKKTSR